MNATTEQMLIYLAVCALGWLLRHMGVGANIKVPGVASPTPTVYHTPVQAAVAHSATATTVKAEAEAAVKAAVDTAVASALSDMKNQLGVQSK